MEFVSTDYNKVNLNTFKSFEGVKVIVFDFDFTLYKGLEWEGYNDFFIKSIRRFFSQFSDEEFYNYLEEYNVLNSDRVSENTAKLMIDLFGTADVLVEFLKDVKFPTNWSKAKVFPIQLIEELSHEYKLYILSNSSKENIEYVSKNIGLDLKYFKNILPNQFDASDLSKMHRLKEIVVKENVKPKEVLMVGDSIIYDLMPAKEMGAKTLLVED